MRLGEASKCFPACRKTLEIAYFSFIIGPFGPGKELEMTKSKDVVTQIRKATRRKFSADEKIRIVLEGLRAETPISEICRREGITASVYYKWSKSFLESGKNGLTKAILRDATSEEVRGLKQENSDLKKAVAELVLEVQRYKKSLGM
jgi:transposase